jgi:signal transduction histidine kinase
VINLEFNNISNNTIIEIILIVVIIYLMFKIGSVHTALFLTEEKVNKLHKALNEAGRTNLNYIRIMRVMAHDLRNPVSGITGIAGLLLDDEGFSDDNRQMLRLIETTGIHSLEMINELLKTGLADENELMIKEPFDIKEIVTDSVELLQFTANDKNQLIVFEHDSTPLIINVNYEKIWRVINNLIVNAIKFSHVDGTIKINIREDENKRHVLLSVADDGIGIDSKKGKDIFEMFTPMKQLGTSGEQSFGLGLSISKKIIEKHDGKIWFESDLNVGTTFYVQLPY